MRNNDQKSGDSIGSVLDEISYDAFISYRHSKIDSMVALTLQKKLERFRTRFFSDKKTDRKIKRVFMDEGELSCSDDFSRDIEAALKNSEWLIVVCSPEAKKSPWVALEVRTFLKYHDRAHVLAVLAEAEPEDAFPEPLLEMKSQEEDGISVTSYEAKALAADFRGSSVREIKKKLNGDQLLKLIAPILGTDLESLRQRQKHYRMQQITIGTAIAAALILLFSGYVVMKNREINEALQQQLLEESKYLTEEAERYIDSGNNIMAVNNLVKALPGEDNERPFYPYAQYLLTKALNLYSLPSSRSDFVSDGIISSGDSLKRTLFTDDTGEYLFGCSYDTVFVWDTDTMEEVWSVQIGYSDLTFFEASGLLSGHRILLGDENKILCYDYMTGELIWENTVPNGDKYDSFGLFAPAEKQDVIYVVFDDRLAVLDSSSGSMTDMSKLPLMEGATACYSEDCDSAVSPDGRYIAFCAGVQTDDNEVTDRKLEIYDIETRKMLKEYDFTEDEDYQIAFLNSDELVILIKNSADKACELSALSLPEVSELWTHSSAEYDNNCMMAVCQKGDTSSGKIILALDFHVYEFAPDDGSQEGHYEMDGFAEALCASPEKLYTISNTGTIYYGDYDSYYTYGYILDCGWYGLTIGQDGSHIYCMPDSNTIIRYSPEESDPQWQEVGAIDSGSMSYNHTAETADSELTGYFASKKYVYWKDGESEVHIMDFEQLNPNEGNDDFYFYSLTPLKKDENTVYCLAVLYYSNIGEDDYPFKGYLCAGDLDTGNIETSILFESEDMINNIRYDSELDQLFFWNLYSESPEVEIYDLESEKWESWKIPDLSTRISWKLGTDIENSKVFAVNQKQSYGYVLNLKQQEVQATIDLIEYPSDYIDYIYVADTAVFGKNHIAISDGENIHIYSETGEEQYKVSYQAEKNSDESEHPSMHFSVDEKYLYYILNSTIVQVDISNGICMQKLQLPDDENIIISSGAKIPYKTYDVNREITDQTTVVWYDDENDPEVIRFTANSLGNSFLACDFGEEEGGVIAEADNVLLYNPVTGKIYTYILQNDTYKFGYFQEYTLEDILKIAEVKIEGGES